jgi:hypothetical protein
MLQTVKQYCIYQVIERIFMKCLYREVNAELCGHTLVPVKIER